MALPQTLRALRHRNYRLYFCTQIFSLLGTWIQTVAMSWLVYRITGSAWLLGITGFAAQVPILLFAPFGGVWSDRFDRRRALLVTQTLAMLQAGTLALLAWNGNPPAWMVIVLAGTLGLINAFDNPLRQSLTASLLDDRADLPNAIALNSFMFNTARLVGPSIAGLLIDWIGESVCFAVNAASYLGVLAVLYSMRLRPGPPRKPGSSVWAGLRAGVDYAFASRPIRSLLMLLAVMSFTITPYVFLMPVFSGEVFHGTARTLGLLIGGAGLGAVSATLFLASRSGVHGLSIVIASTVTLAGLATLAFSTSRTLPLSIGLMALVGAGVIGTAASINTVLQTLVDEHMRGRVMSLYTVAFLGISPLGSLAGGRLAAAIGAPATFAIGAALCLVAAAVFALQLPLMRRDMQAVYERHGIMHAP